MRRFREDIKLLGNYKTRDLDNLAKRYIREQVQVSKLKKYILKEPEFHRIYFQVSLHQFRTIEEQFSFIEENFNMLNDWWHVDQLPQFLLPLPLDFAYKKAQEYVLNLHPFARRWGYVLFMPTLVKNPGAFDLIISLFHNDAEYYVVMAEAWLISYLAIYYPEKTYEFLANCTLNYAITGRAIQKICDSFRISKDVKERYKKLRPYLKSIG